MTRRHTVWGRRTKTSEGGNRGKGYVFGGGARYGDLRAAGEACDRRQADRERWLKGLLRMGRSFWWWRSGFNDEE
jgi:hypothetical protein